MPNPNSGDDAALLVAAGSHRAATAALIDLLAAGNGAKVFVGNDAEGIRRIQFSRIHSLLHLSTSLSSAGCQFRTIFDGS